MEQEYKVKIAKRYKKKMMVHKYETIKNKEEHFLHLKKKEHFLQLCSGHESRLFSFMIWWREMRNIGESSKLKGENI